MPRGGARRGRAGQAYPNRSDLTPTAAPDQTYGMAGQQLAAQQQMPIGAQPSPAGAQGEGAPAGVVPGQHGPLDRPTERPGEPLTAGAPVGPGPNTLPLPSTPDPMLTTIAALNSLGDALHPMLRGVVRDLQASQGNGAGA